MLLHPEKFFFIVYLAFSDYFRAKRNQSNQSKNGECNLILVVLTRIRNLFLSQMSVVGFLTQEKKTVTFFYFLLHTEKCSSDAIEI